MGLFLDPFPDPLQKGSDFYDSLGSQKSQKIDPGRIFRGLGGGPKNGAPSRAAKSEILLLFTTLEQGQTSQKWTPFWELFEDQFCTKYEKMRKRRMPKNSCRKKVTFRENEELSPDPEAP